METQQDKTGGLDFSSRTVYFDVPVETGRLMGVDPDKGHREFGS